MAVLRIRIRLIRILKEHFAKSNLDMKKTLFKVNQCWAEQYLILKGNTGSIRNIFSHGSKFLKFKLASSTFTHGEK